MVFVFLCLYWCLSLSSLSQEVAQPKNFSFCLVDSLGQPITNASVRLNRKSGTIIRFLNLRDTSCATISLPTELDTVVLHITSLGFLPYEKKIPVRDETAGTQTFQLVWAPASLPDAEVRAPVWTRGDTTFYNPEAFAIGDEKKLKELLERLPDFRIDDRGVMRYKNKPIEKIMIEGEELFGDKTELLMSSIPVHVLGQIQAIENQINNPVLRGFEHGNKVFLNLKLKKGVQAAFGDAILAAGLPGRYKIAPTLFLLKDRLKAGLIANYNNLGEGFDWRQQQEARDNNQTRFESWMMNTNPLRIINNFDSRNYVRNALASNRLQMNFPLGKAIMQQEFGYIQDRQRQQSTTHSQLMDSLSTLLRSDSTDLINFPKIFASRTQLKKLRGDSGQLMVQFNVYFDRGRVSNSTRYSSRDQPDGSFQENIGKNYRQFNLFVNQTRKISADRARDFLLTVGHTNLRQEGLAYSARMPQLFSLVNPDYYHQSMLPAANVFYAFGTGSFYKTISGKTRKLNLELNTNRYSYSNEAWFGSFAKGREQLLDAISGRHSHWFHQALVNAGWGTANDRGWRYNFNLHLGAESILSVSDNIQNKIAPAGKLNSQVSRRLSRKVSIDWTVMADRSFRQQPKILNLIRPSGMSNFVSYEGYARRPEFNLNSIFSLRYRPNVKNSAYLAYTLSPNFAQPAIFQSFNGIVRTGTDSLTNRTALGHDLYFNYNFDNPFSKLSLIFHASKSNRQYLYLWDQQLQHRQLHYNSIGYSISKTWDRVTLRAAGRGNQSKTVTPLQHRDAGDFTSWNLSQELNATIRPVKGFLLLARIQYVDGKSSSYSRANFWWSDLETQWRPPEKKFYITFDARNLFNSRGYYLNNVYESMVSSTSIPFIRRNFLIGYYRTI